MILARRWSVVCSVALSALLPPSASANPEVRIGSKAFTESVTLGEIATQLGRSAGVDTAHRAQLGGTRILWEALLAGQIDVYPEYTGTIAQELLPGTPADVAQLRRALAGRGIGITESLGFSDTYALGVPKPVADSLGLRTIDDLRGHPALRFGLSNEFLERKDGWPAVRSVYQLSPNVVKGLDHSLAYRAAGGGEIDVLDLYTTDAEIAQYQFRVLEDSRHVFPNYEAVFLYRLDLDARSPHLVPSLRRLEGTIRSDRMIAMNAAARLQGVPEAQVAAGFLREQLNLQSATQSESLASMLMLRTKEHLWLVGLSLALSILVGLPMGVLAFYRPVAGSVILAVVSVIYTVPSIALLAVMIPFLGIGDRPAVVALFLYGLLPIVRNTHAGLQAIPPRLRESAIVLGLPTAARIGRIELPLAGPSILAGIQTSGVIAVGTATIGALIGAGGYGQPILTGVRLADTRLILLGAIPAGVMALLVQSAFQFCSLLLRRFMGFR